MFHLDFGFILGKNPNMHFFPPKIRLNKNIVEAMGGKKSSEYQKFTNFALDTFQYLRNERIHMLNMLFMMVDASIGNLPKSEHQRILSEMNARFMPEKSKEEAQAEFS